MSKLTPKTLLKTGFIGCLSVAVFLAGTVIASDKKQYGKKRIESKRQGSVPTFTLLPREISKSLKIAPSPPSEPTPLIIGTYWNCFENDQGFETCDIVFAVCNDDQSFCFNVD